VLRIYCGVFGGSGVEDLKAAVQKGLYPWLRADLEMAIRSPNVDGAWWRAMMGSPLGVGEAASHDLAVVRALWVDLYPSHPFPAQPRSRKRARSMAHAR
jgi:hypothetical protein